MNEQYNTDRKMCLRLTRELNEQVYIYPYNCRAEWVTGSGNGMKLSIAWHDDRR